MLVIIVSMVYSVKDIESQPTYHVAEREEEGGSLPFQIRQIKSKKAGGEGPESVDVEVTTEKDCPGTRGVYSNDYLII